MAALHSALAALSPEDFNNVPTNHEELQQYLTELFADAETIIESIPSPPADTSDKSTTRERSKTEASVASSASEVSLSSSRSAPPTSENEDLQKQWGKPLKIKPQENPLGITVYKAAGKDGRGAWFARRSVHEGLGFSKWAKALAEEFPESLAAGTRPGEGNIRGIGGERRVEDINVDGTGHVEVYQLSAQFPGPTTPRDFITLLVTSSSALKSRGKTTPRHYMIISKPCIHEQCPQRNGFIRGQYESVELIREVPRNSTPDSSGTESEEEISDSNPVEWIMVTRSDPGGSVPKFMVERGTPSSICGDAVKFLDWATKQNQADEDTAGTLTRRKSLPPWETDGRLAGLRESGEDDTPAPPVAPSGIFGSAGQLLNQGLQAYAPQAVLDRLQGQTETLSLENPEAEKDVQDTASTISISSASFASAESHASSTPSMTGKNASGNGQLSRYEKELQKLDERKKNLDSKISAAREKASQESASTSAKEAEAAKKAKDKQERELKKEEERYKKEMAKLESRREKEIKKQEERRKKAEEKDLYKQNELLKKEVETMKKERESLLQSLGELQSENTKLTAKLGEVENFPKVPGTETPASGDGVGSPRASTEQIKRLLEERRRASSIGSKSRQGSGFE